MYLGVSARNDPHARVSSCRLLQIIEPANALLLLDWYPSGVDLPLQRIRTFELFARPEFNSAKTQRKSFGRHRQTRVHQNPAPSVVPRPPVWTTARDVMRVLPTASISSRW
jgi:hypothetical protein